MLTLRSKIRKSNCVSNFHFFSNSTQTIQRVGTFIPRNEKFTLLLFGILAMAFFLILIAHLYNNRSLRFVLNSSLKINGLDQLLRENMRISSFSSLLLLSNYLVCFSLCLYLILTRIYYLGQGVNVVILSFLIPLSLLIYEVAGLLISTWLTGEQKKIKGTIVHTLLGNQLSGLILLMISLFWVMNPDKNQFFFLLFLSIIAIKYFIRLVKSSIAIIREGVPLYYIILYFCTLEILPLFIVAYLIRANFNGIS